MFPFFLTFLVIFVVTVYVIKIIIKQENTVTPLVNLPIRNVEGSSQPRVYSVSKKIDNIQHKNQILSEDLEIKTSPETDDNSNEEKVFRRLELIKRDEANPHTGQTRLPRDICSIYLWNSLETLKSSFKIMFLYHFQVTRGPSPHSPALSLSSGSRDSPEQDSQEDSERQSPDPVSTPLRSPT